MAQWRILYPMKDGIALTGWAGPASMPEYFDKVKDEFQRDLANKLADFLRKEGVSAKLAIPCEPHMIDVKPEVADDIA